MNKKLLEYEQARRLRGLGHSMNEIAKMLRVSKGSVSLWVRDVIINSDQKQQLASNSQSRISIERRRTSRVLNEDYKRNLVKNLAKNQILHVSTRELWLIGTALYWAEGGKTQRMVRFSNGDPDMIKIMIRYFLLVCDVPKDRLRGYIHIHDHLDVEAAEKYWQEISGIPKEHFYKTYRKRDGKSKRKTLPHGVLDIYIQDARLFMKIQGWIEGMFDTINSKPKLL